MTARVPGYGVITVAAAGILSLACGGGRSATPPGAPPPPSAAPAPGGYAPQAELVRLYQQLGLLARGAPMPFVGGVSFLASASPDSTHVVVAITMANASLTFARENDRFRAGYSVAIHLTEGGATVKQVEAHETVLVPSYKETSRIDESVIFQELLTLRPGRYALQLTVRDAGSSRGSTENVTLSVPALGDGKIGGPVSFARVAPRTALESLPRIVSSPAASATFGRDTIIGVYLESYGRDGEQPVPLHIAVRTEDGRPLYRDSAVLVRRTNLSSGVVYVPISRVGIGPAMLAFWRPGSTDTSRAPIFVGFGEDLPVASFDEMLNYLRWFTAPYKIKSLRDTAPEFRAAAWAAFVRENASAGGTSDALHEYFQRFAAANAQFREEGMAGWMTDRGKVLLGLGEPDNRIVPNNVNFGQRNQFQIWEYRNLGVQLTFVDQSGFGRWRLTTASHTAFEGAWHRRVLQ